VLTDRGLDAALSALAGRSTVPVDVSVELPHRPPPTVESAEFLAGVRRVGEGGTALDPEVVAPLLGRRRRGNPLDALSPREREVLSLMAEGRSNAAIAAELVVTDGAVEKHVSNIFAKLGLPATASDHRRVLAVLTYLRG
jgi:DNA-binding NarL/FixJ family response regulator